MCKCCCDAVQASKKVTDNIELNDALRKMSTEEQEFYFRGKEKEKLTIDEVEKLKMKNGKSLKGLGEAFRKLKNSEILTKTDTESLANLVDTFM